MCLYIIQDRNIVFKHFFYILWGGGGGISDDGLD